MKHGVSTGHSVSPPLPGTGIFSNPPKLLPVARPAGELQTTETIQPGKKLIHRPRLNSTDDINTAIRRKHGEAFTDSPFEVLGNIKESSYTSSTNCTS